MSEHNCKDLSRQTEKADASVVVNVSRITLFEKGHNESPFLILWNNAMMPHLGFEHMQHFRPSCPPYLIISGDIPHTRGGFIVLKDTNSSLYFREGGHLFRSDQITSLPATPG